MPSFRRRDGGGLQQPAAGDEHDEEHRAAQEPHQLPRLLHAGRCVARARRDVILLSYGPIKSCCILMIIVHGAVLLCRSAVRDR